MGSKIQEERLRKAEVDLRKHYEKIRQVLMMDPDDGPGLISALEQRFGTH